MNVIKAYLEIFLNWQTLLDILLIAAGLFFLYRTFLRLGTWKIFIGMLAAFLVYLVSSILGLEGVEWVFKNVSQVAMLGLIIIFQPELRKILEKIVSLTLKKETGDEEEPRTIIAESLHMLAAQKRGAIVVIPGNEEVLEKLSGGYVLDARPSVPLLMSIFDPHSAGHDGAVIFAADKLTQFGVRLPMSSSSRLSNDYGTRHHAAMGMAEQTDSLVLLVSEERGQVAAFSGGNMKRLGSASEIQEEIKSHYSRLGILQMAQNTYMSGKVFKPAVICILFATVFWSTLILGQKQVVERTFRVPIEYTSPDEGLAIVGGRTDELVVHAAGPKSALNDFGLSAPKAVVQLAQMTAGNHTLLVTGENIRHPREVSLLDIIPAQLELKLAEIIKKDVVIVPQFIGQLPDGLKIRKIETIPERLPVHGPKSENGQRVLSVSTTPIYLNSIRSTSRIICKIIASPSLQPVERRWPDVEVIITVE